MFDSTKHIKAYNARGFTTMPPIRLREVLVKHSDNFPVYFKPYVVRNLRC